jgi:hypothetical protein
VFLSMLTFGCSSSQQPPRIVGDEVHFDKNTVERVSIALGNPRRVGKHYFETKDGVAGQRESSSDIEVWDQTVLVYVFVELTGSGEQLLPVYPKKHARFGTLGGVHEEWREFSAEDRLTADKPWLQLPLHDSIEQYSLLLWSASEPTGWRVARVSASDVATDRELHIRDLLALPKLSDNENVDKYREMLRKHGVDLDEN